MPINRAKKANSTAARRCTIRNFTLVPSLTCGIICSPSSHRSVRRRITRWPPACRSRPWRCGPGSSRSLIRDLRLPCPRTCRNAPKPGEPPWISIRPRHFRPRSAASLCPQLRTALERRWSGAETGWQYPLRWTRRPAHGHAGAAAATVRTMSWMKPTWKDAVSSSVFSSWIVQFPTGSWRVSGWPEVPAPLARIRLPAGRIASPAQRWDRSCGIESRPGRPGSGCASGRFPVPPSWGCSVAGVLAGRIPRTCIALVLRLTDPWWGSAPTRWPLTHQGQDPAHCNKRDNHPGWGAVARYSGRVRAACRRLVHGDPD